MTDAETTTAVEALAYRVRERDAAIRAGEDVADAEVWSLEFMTVLRARGGWRPTEARVVPAWKSAPGGGKPALKPETLDLRAALAADMEARGAAARDAREAACEDGAA